MPNVLHAPLILLIPGLSLPAQMLRDLSFDLALPGLGHLTTEGSLDRMHLGTDTAGLVAALARPAALPSAAPLRLLGLGHDPGTSHWLCLDPVHLSLRERSMTVHDPLALELARADAETLALDLAPLFSDLGELVLATPLAWHLRMNEAPPDFPALPAALARQADVGLSGDRAWRQRLNEAQMMLHAHPVNRARQAHGLPPVNSLWPWGGGSLQGIGAPSAGSHRIQSPDPLLRGYALHAGATATANPVATFPPPAASAHETQIIELNDLRLPAQTGDGALWRDALQSLEQRWFMPLAQARTARRVHAPVHLVFPGRAGVRSLSLAPLIFGAQLSRLWRPLTARGGQSLECLAEP